MPSNYFAQNAPNFNYEGIRPPFNPIAVTLYAFNPSTHPSVG